MAATIWKGTLRLDGQAIGVRFHSGIEPQTIHFHLLHDQDQQRLKQRLVNPETDEAVTYAETRKGLELEPDVFVLLDKEDLDSLEPPADRDVPLLGFYDRKLINHQWYDRPYYLSPDGSEENYFALVEALQETCKEGLCRWTMRRKQYLGALRPYEGYLVMITLRYANEIIAADELLPKTQTRNRPFNTKEIQMAGQLVTALEAPFEPGDYRDEYRERLADFIRQKQEGQTPELPEEEPVAASDSLEQALQASLQSIGK